MNQLILVAALVAVGVVPAAAQSGRFYAAGVAGIMAAPADRWMSVPSRRWGGWSGFG